MTNDTAITKRGDELHRMAADAWAADFQRRTGVMPSRPLERWRLGVDSLAVRELEEGRQFVACRPKGVRMQFLFEAEAA